MSQKSQSPQKLSASPKVTASCKTLWWFISYLVISTLTMPFASRLWIGELPPLLIIQIPKIGLACWLQTHVVIEIIEFFGISSGGSRSIVLSRPYALALAYLIPISIVAVVNRQKQCRFLMATFLAVAVIDYAFTLILGQGHHGLSFY